MAEPLQGPWQSPTCPDCAGEGYVWYCQNCGAIQATGQGAQNPGENPQCNSCGSITDLITCARCGGSGEVDEDLYPGPGQRPAWLQPLVQDSAVTGDDSDDGAEQADDPTTGEDPADDNDQQQQDQ